MVRSSSIRALRYLPFTLLPCPSPVQRAVVLFAVFNTASWRRVAWHGNAQRVLLTSNDLLTSSNLLTVVACGGISAVSVPCSLEGYILGGRRRHNGSRSGRYNVALTRACLLLLLCRRASLRYLPPAALLACAAIAQRLDAAAGSAFDDGY